MTIFFVKYFKVIFSVVFIFLIFIHNSIAQENDLTTKEGIKQFLSSSDWDVVESNHRVEALDNYMLKLLFSYKNDKVIIYKKDRSIFSNDIFFISEIKQLSNGFVSFKLIVELNKWEQKYFEKKQEAHTYRVIDVNTIEICDNQIGPPCKSHFTIKRIN